MLNLVIPAAGLGSRFRNVGYEIPKPMIPIHGIPMVAWVISNFELLDEDEIWIITRSEDDTPNHLKQFTRLVNNKIHFIEIEALTDGPASTLQLALDKIQNLEPVICANSDQYISAPMNDFLTEVRSGESFGQILTMEASGNKWSYIKRGISGLVEQVIEKVQISNEATVGVYAWRNKDIALEAINNMKSQQLRVNNEFYVAPSYNYLAEKKMEIFTFNVGNVESEVHGLGTPEDLDIFLGNNEINKYRNRVLTNLRLPLE